MSTTINGWPKTACTAVSRAARVAAGCARKGAIMIVAVTGGRGVQPTLVRALDALRCTTLRHGRARGVDMAVAQHVGVGRPSTMIEAWPARWRSPDGSTDTSAGPRRNVAMLRGDTHSPAVEWARSDIPMRPRADLLIAWPGGSGTAGCMLAAKRHGIQVVSIGELVERMRGAS